jgi:hypothetical protein
MSGPKRIPLSRSRHLVISDEMVELFKRGLAIQASGEHEKWEDEGGRHGEWIEITKRLDWTLLKRVGEVSVLDDALDDEEMRPVNLHCGGAGWDDGVRLRQALLAAVKGAT